MLFSRNSLYYKKKKEKKTTKLLKCQTVCVSNYLEIFKPGYKQIEKDMTPFIPRVTEVESHFIGGGGHLSKRE